MLVNQGVRRDPPSPRRARQAGLEARYSVRCIDRVRALRDESFQAPASLGEFVAGRNSDMLGMRSQFAESLQSMRQRTLAKHSGSTTPELEADVPAAWTEQQARKPNRQKREGPLMRCPTCDALTN